MTQALALAEEPAGTPRVAVRLEGVRRIFPGGIQAIDSVDLAIQTGEFVAFLGPSGCGKSTLLRIVAGLDRPDAGAVTLDVPDGGRVGETSIAFVFQDPQLLPWRSVRKNVALPLELRGMPRAEREARAAAALVQVGLSDAADRYPAELSGGMRMRASLARALVVDPSILLLDEPFAALDEITRQRLDDLLLDLVRSRPRTVLFVTHAMTEAAYLANRAIVFSTRPARVLVDRAIRLPEDRDASIRTQASFVREVQALSDALSESGA